MIEQLKSTIANIRKNVKHNLEDLVLFFSENPQSKTSFFLCTFLSSLLVCHGLNFNHELVILFGLLISPFSFAFIQFIIGVYQLDSTNISKSLFNIVLGSVLIFLIGFIYYSISPFAFNHNILRELTQVSIPNYLGVFLIAISFGLFNRTFIFPFIYILNILMKWTLLIALASIAIIMKDWIWLKQIVINYKLIFVFLFIGLFLKLWILSIDRKSLESKSIKILIQLLTGLIFAFGIYFGFNELAKLTTDYNVKAYVESEFESKSFQLNNFFIDKSSKEITLYYSGLRPAKAQDEFLKKKFHLEGYHIVFTEIK